MDLKKKAKDKVNLEGMFDTWRELQMEVNPQYSIDDEVKFLLRRNPKWYPLAKEVFEELYPSEFILDIETKTYREWTEEDEWKFKVVLNLIGVDNFLLMKDLD